MMSANQNGEPVRWCLLAKFLEYCRIDKDLCSVDIDKDRVVLTLPKSEASHGLWHRIYIGTSENSLKVMFLLLIIRNFFSQIFHHEQYSKMLFLFHYNFSALICFGLFIDFLFIY